jgi:hypothetical protein
MAKVATNRAHSEKQLFRQHWAALDSDELRFVLLEIIGKPGQYDGAARNPNAFHLPLARDACQIKLTFGSSQEIVAIDAGPAFDPARWEFAVQEIERIGPLKVGRDISFGSYRVAGSWRGAHSGIQILPPPSSAPQSQYEMGAHPFVLEFLMVTNCRGATVATVQVC